MTKKKFAKLAAIFALGCALMLLATLAKKHRAKIEWNGQRCDIQNVNALDAQFARPYNKNLDRLGDVFAALAIVGAAMPAALTFFLSKDKRRAFEAACFDGFAFITCFLYSNSVHRILKTLAGRFRPYMYFPNPSAAGISSHDFYRSWPSGHSSTVFFSFAFLLGWLLWRNPNAKCKKFLLAAELLICAATMALRMLSGNHFLTDVLSGAAIGFAASFAVFGVCCTCNSRD